MSTNITLTGFKEFEAKLKNLPANLMSEVDMECHASALEWSSLAIKTAPVGKTGFLKGGINAPKKNKTAEYELVSRMNYSPYNEWGTGDFVSVPADLQDYAIQFKGRRKVRGMRPHPFFFIHKPFIERDLVTNIKKILNTEH